MAEDLHELVVKLSDQQFEQLYGPLARLDPSQAAVLLDGLGDAVVGRRWLGH